MSKNNVYGLCPFCGEVGINRERRMNGYTRCVNKHKWVETVGRGLNEIKLEQAIIRIEEICMLYDTNGNSQALEEIANMCSSALENKR